MRFPWGRPDLVERAWSRICPDCREQGIGIPSSISAILARAELRADRPSEAIRLCESVLSEASDDQEVLWDYWWALDEIGAGEKAVYGGFFFAANDSRSLDEDLVPYEEQITRKDEKFKLLLRLAEASENNTTYSADLIQANNATEPIFGSATIVGKAMYSVEDLLAAVTLHAPQDRAEVQFSLAAQQRGDRSPVVTQLREQLGNWDELPHQARVSLIEGEFRWIQGGSVDYSSIVMTFAKAVEISLRELSFNKFRQMFTVLSDADFHMSAAREDKKYDRVERFVSYLSSGQHMELGSMALTLELSTGRRQNVCLFLDRFVTSFGVRAENRSSPKTFRSGFAN